MAWIEVHESIREHHKLYALADGLGVEQYAAGGVMVFLWTWALTNAPDGSLSRHTSAAIARACHWKKKPELLIQALIASGFVDDDMNIHNWSEYAGKLIDRRSRNKERMRSARAQNVQRTCATQNEHVRNTCKATVPNLTLEEEEEDTRTREDEYGNPLPDPEWGKVMDCYLAQIGTFPGGSAGQKLQTYTDDMGADVVCLAIEQANLSGANTPLPYLLRTLEAWFADGVRTLAQANAVLLDRERRRNAAGNTHPKQPAPLEPEQPRVRIKR